MNQANLAKLFHNYIESYNVLTDAEHDELYKWRAVNHFQKHWNLEADEFVRCLNRRWSSPLIL